MNASYGNYDFMNLQGGVSVPLVQDKAAVRVSGTWRKRDGYLKTPTGGESNDRDRWMLHGQIYAEPTDALSIRILADYAKTDEQCCGAVNVVEGPTAPAIQLGASLAGLTGIYTGKPPAAGARGFCQHAGGLAGARGGLRAASSGPGRGVHG